MQEQASEFAAFIGIGWADRKHDVCLRVPGVPAAEISVLEHRPNTIDAWARQRRERFGGRPIAVCLDLAQGPIVSALLEYDLFVVFPVNPSTLAKYGRAFVPSGAKDDPTDAALALDLLLRHPEKVSPLRRESENIRALRKLVEARRDLVQDRVRVTNRLTFTLKEYLPQIVEWFRDKETDVFAAFLERWPSLKAAQRARRDTLVAFFHAHSVRRAITIDRRIDAIRTERPLTSDPAIIEPALAVVATLVPQLRALSAGITRLDAAIATRCAALPDFPLFSELPGAGPVFASRLLAAFGEQRERFPNAAAVQKCVGIAPVTERSGNKHWVHWRWACPTFLRQTFVEWAASSISQSFWARAFYDSHRAKGSSHNAPYNESRYLSALQKRQSPLLKFAAQPS